MANYGRELRMGIDIRRKGKIEKATEFAKRIKKMQEEAGVVLKRVQKEIKQQADKGRKEAKKQKVGNKIMLSTKDLIFKERLVKKLVDQYVGLYIINEIVSTNVIKL